MGLIDSLKKASTRLCKTISMAQAQELLGSGATLIDVRSAQERRTGRAPQAKLVPLGRVQASTAGIQKTRPVIAVCASGVRSASAARLLAAKGYVAYSVRGGMAHLAPGRRTSPLTTTTPAENHFEGESHG
jgi:rhodanese-related sulfurtransferase